MAEKEMEEDEFLRLFGDMRGRLGKFHRYKRLRSPEERPKSLLGVNGVHLLLKLLQRSHDLIEDAEFAVSRKRTLLFYLAVRAHFETSANLGHFLKGLRKLYSKEMERGELERLLVRLSVGGRMKPDGTEIPDPIGIMSAIDSSGDLQRLAGIEAGRFRECYEFLSEFCHPNFFGGAYKTKVDVDTGTITFLSDQESFEEYAPGAYLKFLVSLSIFEMHYAEAWSLIEKNEIMPILEA